MKESNLNFETLEWGTNKNFHLKIKFINKKIKFSSPFSEYNLEEQRAMNIKYIFYFYLFNRFSFTDGNSTLYRYYNFKIKLQLHLINVSKLVPYGNDIIIGLVTLIDIYI